MSTPSKSFFEQEAERLAKLNVAKNKPSTSVGATLIGWLLAAGVFVVIILGVFIPITIYSVVAHGYVLAKLWSWFVVPLGITSITWLHAAGIVGLIRLCTYHIDFSHKADESDVQTKVLKYIGLALVPWVSLLFGYAIHRFM